MTRSSSGARGFQLIVVPVDTDSYSLRLEQIDAGDAESTTPLATLRAHEVLEMADPIQTALKSSKQPRSVLSAGRRKPVVLDETAGVRLALTLMAAEPVTKRSRREAILGGVAAMSSEETYYWFAKVTGQKAPRARRALRILLADDGRSGITA